jgi:hypothetical protein
MRTFRLRLAAEGSVPGGLRFDGSEEFEMEAWMFSLSCELAVGFGGLSRLRAYLARKVEE